ncbi:MAG: FeoB small GTPase domain-containing protein, partial [Candidatus Sericytochromatia bacterium]
MKTFLLVGFPNSGKSTIFNLLSGKNRKVGNYSGITVDTSSAELKSNSENSEKIRIIDLPGIYNLLPSSLDEAVTVETILNLNDSIDNFHEIVLVIDASKLEAGLALALSVRDITGNNISLLVNKSDLIYNHKKIDWEKLKKKTGFRILNCSASQDEKNSSVNIDKFLRDNMSDNPIKNLSTVVMTQKSFDLLPSHKKNNNSVIEIAKNEHDILSKIEKYNNESRRLIKEVSSPTDIDLVRSTYKIDKI